MTVVHEEHQDLLRRLHDERLTACAGGRATPPGLSVIVVLSALDPAAFVTGALRFTLGLDRDRAATWMRAYTRAVFLAGNPANLRDRFPFRHVTPDGRVAWTDPGDPDAHTGLRRLLRTFHGTTPLDLPPLVDVDVPGAPPTGTAHDLYVAAGTAGRYLVDVHHTLAEAVLRDIVRPGDRLRVRHMTDMTGLAGPPEYARVIATPDGDGRLRPVTWLTRADGVPAPSAPSPRARPHHTRTAGTEPVAIRKGSAA